MNDRQLGYLMQRYNSILEKDNCCKLVNCKLNNDCDICKELGLYPDYIDFYTHNHSYCPCRNHTPAYIFRVTEEYLKYHNCI